MLLSIPSAELKNQIQSNPKWAELIEGRKFEIEKAELSLMCTPDKIRQINPSGFKDIFLNQTPTLATIKKYHGEEKSIAAICACLISVNDFFGQKSGLDENQIITLSNLIFSEYWYLTLADLKYCIRQGILGRYEEKIYGKATPDVIMRWISLHIDERQGRAAEISKARHEARMMQQKEDFETGEFLPVEGVNREIYVERLKEVREKLDLRILEKKELKAKEMLESEEAIKAQIKDLNEALEVLARLKDENPKS